MNRPIVKIGLFLLLGAIVNVAVAWSCARLVTRLSGPTRPPTEAESRWWANHPGDPSRQPPEVAYTLRGFGVTHTEMHNGKTPDFPWREVAAVHRAGWPLLSMEGYLWGNSTDHRHAPLERHAIWHVDSNWRFLPLKPLPVGLAINTLFYAVILWLLFAAPFALRRRLRIQRGLCPACAYPIGDSPVCTECGKPVKTKRVEVSA